MVVHKDKSVGIACMKRLFAFFVVALAAGLLAHGVPAPRLLWEGYLTALQTRLPDYDIHVGGVVIGLSHKPVLMVSGIQIKSKTSPDHLDVGLIRLEVNALASWRRDEWAISDFKLKGVRSLKYTSEGCEGLPMRCWHTMPLRVLAQVDQMLQHKVNIQNMEWEQVEFGNRFMRNRHTDNPIADTAEANFGVTVEDLKYKAPLQSGLMRDVQSTGTVSAGIKVFETPPVKQADTSKPNQIYISFKAKQALLNKPPAHNTPDNMPSEGKPESSHAWKFDAVEADLTGQWTSGQSSYPWSGSVAVGSVLIKREDLAPFVKLQASELRSYISRLDSPADHQAAFSARQIEGGLPRQDFIFKQAEWTYTHEDAEAWTFDLLLKQATGSEPQTLAEITPSHIPGSEGIPALAQTRVLGCKQSSSYWYWLDGWFRQQGMLEGKHIQKNAGGTRGSTSKPFTDWVWCKR